MRLGFLIRLQSEYVDTSSASYSFALGKNTKKTLKLVLCRAFYRLVMFFASVWGESGRVNRFQDAIEISP